MTTLELAKNSAEAPEASCGWCPGHSPSTALEEGGRSSED
jgi:hypothetical protein